MNLPEILNYISQTSQSIVKFLFASKWTFWIIGIIIVMYLIWRGLGKKKPTEDEEEEK